MYAIVGGSGFEKFDGFKTLETLPVDTPFGPASSGLKRVKIGEHECLFLSRHGEHHEKMPSEVNFRANIFALKNMVPKQFWLFLRLVVYVKRTSPAIWCCAHTTLIAPKVYVRIHF